VGEGIGEGVLEGVGETVGDGVRDGVGVSDGVSVIDGVREGPDVTVGSGEESIDASPAGSDATDEPPEIAPPDLNAAANSFVRSK
jgi:hypothetical protein